MGPSTPRPPRRSKRDRANERAPPQANIVPHLYNHANLKRDRMAEKPKLFAICFRIQERTQMFCRHAGRATCCSTSSALQILHKASPDPTGTESLAVQSANLLKEGRAIVVVSGLDCATHATSSHCPVPLELLLELVGLRTTPPCTPELQPCQLPFQRILLCAPSPAL